MANSLVRLPLPYIGDFNKGRPLFNAQIFIGEPDLDPEIPANQKVVTGRQEDGTLVTMSQPVRTSSGGYPIYNNAPIELLVDGAYSLKVLNKNNGQEYYFADVEAGRPVTFDDKPVLYRDTVAEAKADVDLTVGMYVTTKGYHSPNDGGGANYIVVAGGTRTDDGGSYHDMANGNQLEYLGETISLYQFGAIGDGVADDAGRINAALNSGLAIIQSGGNFLFESDILIPSGTDIRFSAGSQMIKKGLVAIKNKDFPNYSSDIYIENLSYTQESTSSANRGHMTFLFVDGLKIINIKIRNIAQTSSTGARSLFVSGKGVYISGIDIDSTQGKAFADGLFCAYLEDAVITNGTINAGDDAIALFYPALDENAGRDLPSKNVNISNLNLGSVDGNVFRGGASPAVSGGTPANSNSYWDDVIVSNITDISEPDSSFSGRRITLLDQRTAAQTSNKNNFKFVNFNSSKSGTQGTIGLFGNPNVNDTANLSVKNIGRVVIEGSSFKNTKNAATITGGGCDSVTVLDSNIERDFVASFNSLNLKQITQLRFINTRYTTGGAGSTGVQMDVSFVENVEFTSTDIIGSNEFVALRVSTNALQDTNLTIKGGSISNTQRGLDNSDAVTPYSNLQIVNTSFSTSVVDITNNAQNFTAGTITKTGTEISSSQSIGAGTTPNGTIKVQIGGVDYFLLTSATA